MASIAAIQANDLGMVFEIGAKARISHFLIFLSLICNYVYIYIIYHMFVCVYVYIYIYIISEGSEQKIVTVTSQNVFLIFLQGSSKTIKKYLSLPGEVKHGQGQ